MGRAQNSFTSWVGHAEETIDDVRVTLPEKDLWVAVLCRAVLDACKGPPDLDMSLKANKSHQSLYNYNRDQARHFFSDGGYHFRLICEMAGRNPEYVQAKIRKVLLRKMAGTSMSPLLRTIARDRRKEEKCEDPRKNMKTNKWGGHRPRIQIYKYHEVWAKENGYREVDNDQLNVKNSERFINYEKEKEIDT